MSRKIRIASFSVPVQGLYLRLDTTALITFRRRIAEWSRRIRERNELRKLSERDLADFACSKADAAAETSKWFWQAYF